MSYVDMDGRVDGMSFGHTPEQYEKIDGIRDIKNFLGVKSHTEVIKDTVDMTLFDIAYLTFGWLTDIDNPDKNRRESVRACWKEFITWQGIGFVLDPTVKGAFEVIKESNHLKIIGKYGLKYYPYVSVGRDIYNLGKCLRKCGRKK